jgi:pimeloyl-ACP methyl ester carboxylesterase
MTQHTLVVPGARLYYEVEGEGPALLLIPGGASDSMLFSGVREILAEYYTVITYDPRGISLSPLDGTPRERGAIREHADDVQRLLAEVSTGPAYVFAHCGGAVLALDHVVRHHEQVHTLVLHEPYLNTYLDPRLMVGPDLPTIYREQGLQAVLRKFKVLTDMDVVPAPANPSPAMLLRMNHEVDNLDYFFDRLMPAIIDFTPDLETLRVVPTRIVIGVGEKSAGQLAHTSALRLAADVGLEVVSFPGDHYSFVGKPAGFAMRLRQLLARRGRPGSS